VKTKTLLQGGFVGPVIFTFIVFVSGILYPSYNHITTMISGLGATDSPVNIFMNIFGFVLFGFLTVAFAFGVYRIRNGIFGKLAALFFAIGGIGMTFIGLWPIGPGAVIELHGFAVFVWIIGMFLAFIFLAINVRKEKSMRFYPIAIFVMFYMYNYSAKIGIPGVSDGLAQRGMMGSIFLFTMYTSWKLQRLKTE